MSAGQSKFIHQGYHIAGHILEGIRDARLTVQTASQPHPDKTWVAVLVERGRCSCVTVIEADDAKTGVDYTLTQ